MPNISHTHIYKITLLWEKYLLQYFQLYISFISKYQTTLQYSDHVCLQLKSSVIYSC